MPLGQTAFAVALVTVSLPVLAHNDDICLPMVGMDGHVCRHHFEGERINLPVREALEPFGSDCERLVVSVLQRQGLMLAELGETQEFDGEQCSTMDSFALELPDVRSEVDILVRFSSPGSEIVPELLAVRVYPDTLLTPLVKLSELHTLIVFDEAGLLAEFFDNNEIQYVHGFESAPDDSIAMLVEPDKPEQLLEGRKFASAIVFQEKVFALPQVRAVTVNERTRIYVETPLLRDLSTNPLAQKALLDIFRLATNPSSTDRG